MRRVTVPKIVAAETANCSEAVRWHYQLVVAGWHVNDWVK